MNKFYSSEMSNLDMRPFVQKSEQQLRLWHSAPELLMSPTLNAFGEPLCPESDDVLSALLCLVSGEDDIQREALKALVQACLDILHSQLGLFLTNPEPSADIIKNQYVRQLTIWHLKEPWVAWIKCFAVPQSLLVVSSKGKYGQNLINAPSGWRAKSQVSKTIISFAISEAKLERVRRFVSDREVIEEIDRRKGVVATERNEKEKKLALKSISKCLKEKSIEGLVECSEIVKEKVQRFINEPKNLLGLAFLHSRDSEDFNGH